MDVTKYIFCRLGGIFLTLFLIFQMFGSNDLEKTNNINSVAAGESYNLLLNAEPGDIFIVCYGSVCKPYIITAHHGTWIEYAGADWPLQNDGSYIGMDASIANLTSVRGVVKANSRPEIRNQFLGKLPV